MQGAGWLTRSPLGTPATCTPPSAEREFFIGNLLVRIHFIIEMIRWTGLAPWEFEFPFPGSLTSTFLVLHMRDEFAARHPGHVHSTICGSEAGYHLRLIDFVYHSTLGLRVIKVQGAGCRVQG